MVKSKKERENVKSSAASSEERSEQSSRNSK